MTPQEVAWMQTMLLQDEKEEYEQNLEFIEYLASFSNPEAIRRIREQRKGNVGMSDAEFADVMKSISGREVPLEEINSRSKR